MLPEPDNAMNRLLKAFADKRRRDAGEPIELHPATRRMFQSAVAREHKRAGGDQTVRSRILVSWLPRLAGVAVILAFLGVLGWTLFQPGVLRKERDLARVSQDSLSAPSLSSAEEKQVGQPSSLTTRLPAANPEAALPLVTEPPAASIRQNAPKDLLAKRDADAVPAVTASRAEPVRMAPAMPAEGRPSAMPVPPAAPRSAVATKPQATIESAAAGSRAVELAAAPAPGKAEALALLEQRKQELADRLDAKESVVGGALGRGDRLPEALLQKTADGAVGGSQAGRDTSLTKFTVTSAAGKGSPAREDLYRGVAEDTVGAPRSTVGKSGMAEERFAETPPTVTSSVTAAAPQPQASRSLARPQTGAELATNERAEVAALRRARNAQRVDAKESSSRPQEFYFQQSLVTKAQAAGGIVPADSSEPLTSFSWQQNGRQLHVVDQDGSVYTGEWREIQSTWPTPQQSDKALRFKGDSATSLAQFGVGLQAGQTAGTFRVVGTNQTLRQRILFEGSLVRESETEVLQRPTVKESTGAPTPARLAPVAAVETKSVPSTNVPASEAQRASGALRIQAKATFGDGRVLPIQAVGK